MRFDLGQIAVTPGVMGTIPTLLELGKYLQRHQNGDWGTMCKEDCAANNAALTHGDRIMSSYLLSDNTTTIWIITEWDRSVTTILLPEEY